MRFDNKVLNTKYQLQTVVAIFLHAPLHFCQYTLVTADDVQTVVMCVSVHFGDSV